MSALFAILLLASLALSAAVAFAGPALRRRFGVALILVLVLVWVSLGLSLFGIVGRTSGAMMTRLSERRPQHVESAAGGALTLLLSLGGPAMLATALGLWALRSSRLLPRAIGALRRKGPRPKLLVVTGPGRELEEVRALYSEYARALAFDRCFEKFDEELSALPGDASPPRGKLWLARIKGQPAACVALRPLDLTSCELLRLYVRPQFRHVGLGRELAELACAEARSLGFRRVRLDTLPQMREAIALYRSLRFQEIPPYRKDAPEGSLALERALDA